MLAQMESSRYLLIHPNHLQRMFQTPTVFLTDKGFQISAANHMVFKLPTALPTLPALHVLQPLMSRQRYLLAKVRGRFRYTLAHQTSKAQGTRSQHRPTRQPWPVNTLRVAVKRSKLR